GRSLAQKHENMAPSAPARGARGPREQLPAPASSGRGAGSGGSGAASRGGGCRTQRGQRRRNRSTDKTPTLCSSAAHGGYGVTSAGVRLVRRNGHGKNAGGRSRSRGTIPAGRDRSVSRRSAQISLASMGTRVPHLRGFPIPGQGVGRFHLRSGAATGRAMDRWRTAGGRRELRGHLE